MRSGTEGRDSERNGLLGALTCSFVILCHLDSAYLENPQSWSRAKTATSARIRKRSVICFP